MVEKRVGRGLAILAVTPSNPSDRLVLLGRDLR